MKIRIDWADIGFLVLIVMCFIVLLSIKDRVLPPQPKPACTETVTELIKFRGRSVELTVCLDADKIIQNDVPKDTPEYLQDVVNEIRTFHNNQ